MADDEQDQRTEPASTPAPTPSEDVTGLKSALAAERAARKDADKALRELQAWKQEQEDRGKSETDRLRAEAERARQAAQDADARVAAANERVIRAEVTLAAQRHRFADPDDAWALIDRSKLALDESGTVSGAEEAVKALADKKPHLVSRDEREATTYGVPSPGRQRTPGGDQAMREEHERLATLSGLYTPF